MSKQEVTEQVPLAVIQIVPGTGTDAEIAERCAEKVPGWNDLTDKSKADLVRLMRWFEDQGVTPAMVSSNGVMRHPEGANTTLHYLRMAEVFASASPDHTDRRLNDLTRYANRAGGDNSAGLVSSMIAFVKGVAPEDPAESALAVQMAATHDAAMYALGQMRSAEYVEQAKTFGTIGAKLLNAYTRQAEVLTKMQRGGEQVVRHVHTYIDNRNGQAIIAENVHTGGQGANSKSGYQANETTGAEAIGLCASMPGAQPFGQPVPIAGCEGQEALPSPRRGERIRRAKGQ